MQTEPNDFTLEERISLIEKSDNASADLTGSDWISLLVLGVIIPSCLLLWGW